jgi:hypothetical protein
MNLARDGTDMDAVWLIAPGGVQMEGIQGGGSVRPTEEACSLSTQLIASTTHGSA